MAAGQSNSNRCNQVLCFSWNKETMRRYQRRAHRKVYFD